MTGNPVNPYLVRKAYNQAAPGYEKSAVLQKEVETRLLHRLDLVRLAPVEVVDLGCGTTRSTVALRGRYEDARVTGMDFSLAMLREGSRNSTVQHPIRRCCADITRLPLADASVDLLFSNLAMHWCNDPASLFAGLRRVLRPGGLFLFTTFGPDTLGELRQSWAAADEYAHVNDFLDLHDIGDALLHAGFSEPVMDAERIVVTYPSVKHLMNELKATGGHNVTDARRHSLTAPIRLQAMLDAYAQYRDGDRFPATFEINYGVAWGPAEGQPHRSGEGEVATFSVDHLRQSRDDG